MSTKMKTQIADTGAASYESWRDTFLANPENRQIYEEEATKKELWLQLVEAREISGLTQQQVAERMGVSQAQVARIEKRGYESYTLRTVQRYIRALGAGFTLEIAVSANPTHVSHSSF